MQTLTVRRRQVGGAGGTQKDAHGNPVVTFADPAPWPVYGAAPGVSVEGGAGLRDLSTILWEVYAPAGDQTPHELDRVIGPDGTEYEVDGRPQDYTRGPWPHPTAGVVVTLKRVEG